jgi:RNA-directed DNA polymerase
MRVASRRYVLMSGLQQKKRQRPYEQKLLWSDCSSEPFVASCSNENPTVEDGLMEEILEQRNLRRALKRVRSNKGAPGVDGMTVKELGGYLRRHWPKIRAASMEGRYRPLPVRRKEIEKPDGGGWRLLGIPAVVDRFIQQAVAQVLSKRWEPIFSDSSFGFRPGRSQHDAVFRAQGYLRAGFRYVVDIDLSKFFDRVHHDRLMSRLTTRVKDARVLKLVRAFLESGVLVGGLTEPTDKGVPQGGPLSPVLSNIVLDELDKELERRGHRFVRYADDIVIYVRSKRAGERVLESVARFLTGRMRLEVNAAKSGVKHPWRSNLLGFTFTNSVDNPKIRLHWKTVKRLKERIRELTGRSCGRSLQWVIRDLTAYLHGWWNYFGIIQSINRLRGLRGWILRRLRALVWKQWKRPKPRARELMRRGIPRVNARRTGAARKGPWRMSAVKWVAFALPGHYFESLALVIPWSSTA